MSWHNMSWYIMSWHIMSWHIISLHLQHNITLSHKFLALYFVTHFLSLKPTHTIAPIYQCIFTSYTLLQKSNTTLWHHYVDIIVSVKTVDLRSSHETTEELERNLPSPAGPMLICVVKHGKHLANQKKTAYPHRRLDLYRVHHRNAFSHKCINKSMFKL